MKDPARSFSDTHAKSYVEGPPRLVPGFDALHRMMSMLLAERTPPDARILVLGAGGGLELRTLAADHPGWRFDGVDPSTDMLAEVHQTAAPYMDRIALTQGTIEAAPEAAFDAATCLLTFHFIARENRLPTLREIRRRLKPGAPFVLAHISFPQTEPERSLWIDRHIAWGGTFPGNIESAREAISTRLTILSPEEEEAMLTQAGFASVSLFYAGLSFKGWVGYAG
ncbi:class I SAM-dependent methyltransferase [Pelagibacterium limicola]|uniref:class I SAM-dependent methyltransferase n=1 Tax=Pelagibacterium limicola TaxID=2791022 RepID=UPI0018AFDCFF|nr:class I SAM-dependent methyltransferase [Pelagibacterium limicola]